MKRILFPKKSFGSTSDVQVEAPEISLGGSFYDCLRTVDGQIAGVRYWLIEHVNFNQHPVYSQFIGDDRFVFDDAGDYVDIVFDEKSTELLQNGQLTVDVVQEFGGEGVLRCGDWLAIAFSLVD